MRAEEILKESELFARKDECYIHVEKTSGGVYQLHAVGDPKALMGGVLCVLKNLSVSRDVPMSTILKTLKRMDKCLTPVTRVNNGNTES